MQYKKKPTTIVEQIDLLKNRGLLFRDEQRAQHYLSNISYYRLRAYTYPFQEVNDGHKFKNEIYFEDIIDLYVFDRKLRMVVFDAIEKIEIALRTKLIYNYSLVHGSHWHENADLYRNKTRFITDISDLFKEIDRSTETFIEHYRNKYTTPQYPACWMSLEVVSMGLLSKIFKNLKNCDEKKKIYREFGLFDYSVLESWLHSICHVRNICAHHGRLWNRRLTAKPVMPRKTAQEFLKNTTINTNKLYATLSCIIYILGIISPGNNFAKSVKSLFSKTKLLNLKEMGFPNDWENESLWK